MTPTDKAKEVFEKYAAMDTPNLPVGHNLLSVLQVRLYRWQVENQLTSSVELLALGATEEIGELAHAIVKHRQKIRGMEDETKFREAAGDAIADTVVYLVQLCTALRLDFGTLFANTALKVMERNWVKDQKTGGET